MSAELEHELSIFDRPDGRSVGVDWMPYPDTFINEMDTTVAEWLLAHFSGEPVPANVAAWLRDVRGEHDNAQAQGSLLEAQ